MLIIWSHDYSFSLCNMKKLLDVTLIVNSLVPLFKIFVCIMRLLGGVGTDCQSLSRPPA